MTSTMNPDRRVAERARRQHGLITLDDARAVGLTAEQVKGRLRSGRWFRVSRAVTG